MRFLRRCIRVLKTRTVGVLRSFDIPEVEDCKCGGTSDRMFPITIGIIVDDWTPETMDAQRDIDHFNKPIIVNGKYRSRKTMYYHDQQMNNPFPETKPFGD